MIENNERKWIIGIISDGAKSDYWKILKATIQEWIIEENKRLDYYKGIGIKHQEDSDKYNRGVDRIVYLKKLLTINETIVEHHKSLIEQIKEKIEDGLERLIDVGESFVRRIVK